MSEQDEQWFDALAGHAAPASAQDHRLQQALRRAARHAASAQPDDLAEQRLLRRLQDEGLLAQERPVARRRIAPLRWAQVAVIVLCVGVVLQISRPPGLQETKPAEMIFEEGQSLPPARERVAAPAVHFDREVEKSVPNAKQEPAQSGFAAPSQAMPSAPQVARKPSAALADRAQAENRLVAPAVYIVVLKTSDSAKVLQQLSALLDSQSDIVLLDDELQQDKPVRLRCTTEDACEQLQQVFTQLGSRLSDPLPRNQIILLQWQPAS